MYIGLHDVEVVDTAPLLPQVLISLPHPILPHPHAGDS